MSEVLVNQRKFIRRLVTEIHNKKGDIPSYDSVKLDLIKSRLTDHQTKLNSLNESLLVVFANKSDFNFENEFSLCNEYDLKIGECLSIINSKTKYVSSPLQGVITQLKGHSTPLPKYSGKEDEDFFRFICEFEQAIARFNYSDYDRLLLLKQQLSSRALTLINSLEADKQTFAEAKNLLNRAFGNNDAQKFSVIKQLCNIKLSNDGDPYSYVSEMRNISERVKRLGLTSDDYLRYFYWNGLNLKFQTHLVAISNHTRPTLNEIETHFFEACERYSYTQKSKQSKNHQSENITVDYASNIKIKNDKKPFCLMCNKSNKPDDHFISKCTNFPTPSSKIDQLKALKGCLICGQINHLAKDCKIAKKIKCYNCEQPHMSYLCPEGKKLDEIINETPQTDVSKKAKNKKANSSVNTHSKVTVSEVLNIDADERSILPTFSCLVNEHKIRAFKDCGCQSNFVSERLASELQLKTVKDNVDLSVKGINVLKRYKTRSVEVNLNVGGIQHTINALCLPEIDINLNLPNLSIVIKEFTDRGYDLVDDNLVGKDKIDNIEFILGVKSAFCLPESEIVFGKEGKSVYSSTPAGILLKGDIDQLIGDLPFLPLSDDICRVKSVFQAVSVSCDDAIISEPNFSDNCESNSNFSVLDDKGNLIESELDRAANEMLDRACNGCLDSEESVDVNFELNNKLVKYVLENTDRTEDGRLRMPLTWNSNVSHLLGKNYNLSKAILNSLTKKLDESKLNLIDKVFKEQESLGIIEKIENCEAFLNEHPEHSFLPYMGIFKMNRETTKCRVVFLSNLCEKVGSYPQTVSHNQSIHAGPSLNQKLSSSIIHLRFDKYLLCFDIIRAFNNVVLKEEDQNRLLFLWYKNIQNGDKTLILYRNIRLTFGLRCSPTILLLALFKILILDIEGDSEFVVELKKQIYQLAYMDNLAITFNEESDLKKGYTELSKIFDPYCFGLQQFITNEKDLSKELCEGKEPGSVSGLLGLQWDKKNDVIRTRKIELNINAVTKREVLSTIASQFDLFQYNGPLLNRARIFLHVLQSSPEIEWDTKLSDSNINEWTNICRQANSSNPIEIDRSFGDRKDEYDLIAFSDSSNTLLGCVLYLMNLKTRKLTFLLAKNKFVGKTMKGKSIPSLELQAVVLATECSIDIYQELSGNQCLNPIKLNKIRIYSDSLVVINWLIASNVKMDKMQKKSVFVLNRLERIRKLCEAHEIEYSFIPGIENPADAITRPLSEKMLARSNFICGPTFLSESRNKESVNANEYISVTIPNPLVMAGVTVVGGSISTSVEEVLDVPINRYSSLSKLISVVKNVLIFVNKLKCRLKSKDNDKFKHLCIKDESFNFHECALLEIIKFDQRNSFSEVSDYFLKSPKEINKIPNLVNQLNLFMDKFGVIRVKNKCEKILDIKRYGRVNFPILLSRSGFLTNLIIRDIHEKMAHSGCYTVLCELKKFYYIPKIFSTVRKILRKCINCKKFNARTIKVNQSAYRESRLSPECIPFREIYLDYMGPFNVKSKDSGNKIWILIITCMWTRAVNLKVCINQSCDEFLQAFQLHIFDYGVPEKCTSDLGSQLVSGANYLKTYFSDMRTKNYLDEKGIKCFQFDHYFKGRSELGSLVETCVKAVKKLLVSSIKKNVLALKDFTFIVCQTVHLINKRPVAFKETLRDNSIEDYLPDIITPEKIIRGYELPSMNILPYINNCDDPDWKPGVSPENIKVNYRKFQSVRESLVKTYNEEFLSNLIVQAVDRKDRYKPVSHETIEVGDVVLLKEDFTKPYNYPMAVVKSIVTNDSGEVTGALLLKGKSREIVKRHSSSLIKLLSPDIKPCLNTPKVDLSLAQPSPSKELKNRRKAFIKSQDITRRMLNN